MLPSIYCCAFTHTLFSPPRFSYGPKNSPNRPDLILGPLLPLWFFFVSSPGKNTSPLWVYFQQFSFGIGQHFAWAFLSVFSAKRFFPQNPTSTVLQSLTVPQPGFLLRSLPSLIIVEIVQAIDAMLVALQSFLLSSLIGRRRTSYWPIWF